MTDKIEIRRGDVIDVNLDGAIGVEKMNDRSAGSRPCVVVQNDRGNEVSPLTQVVPLTDARQYKRFPVQVFLAAADLEIPDAKDSSVECGHVRTIDRSRILTHRGRVTQKAMSQIDAALRISLAL